MFHPIRLLEFMKREAPTYGHIAFEVLSTLDLKLLKKWIEGTRYYYGTLKFCLFNQNFELSVEESGHIVRFPICGPEDIPNKIYDKNFWVDSIGIHFYTATREKGSTIQNPCFWDAQKAIIYTLFGQGDSTGVDTKERFSLCIS